MAEDKKKRFSEELTKERPRRKRTRESSSQTDEEDDLLSGQSVLKLDEYFLKKFHLSCAAINLGATTHFVVSLYLFYEMKNINV